MDDAIWYLIGDSVIVVSGALLAWAFLMSFLIAALDGLRNSRRSVIKAIRGVLSQN